MSVPRGLSDADRAAWAAYVARVAALPGRTAAPPLETPAPREPPPPVGRGRLVRPAVTPRLATAGRVMPTGVSHGLTVGEAPAGVDGAMWRRFRGGKLLAARKLDLHGYTAQRAFHALVGFLRAAQADRLRCVEVVTGRGSGGETGVLRRELPLWLNLPDIRPLVLGAAHSHPANPGAVRLLLQRVQQA